METIQIVNPLATAEEKRAAKLELLIVQFSKDPCIIDVVEHIEKKSETTQNHYGDYLAFLSEYAKDALAFHIISQALIRAGANPDGVSWAKRLIKGE